MRLYWISETVRWSAAPSREAVVAIESLGERARRRRRELEGWRAG